MSNFAINFNFDKPYFSFRGSFLNVKWDSEKWVGSWKIIRGELENRRHAFHHAQSEGRFKIISKKTAPN